MQGAYHNYRTCMPGILGKAYSVMIMYCTVCVILPSLYLNPLCTAKVVLEKYSIQSMNSTGTPKLALLSSYLCFHEQIFK